MLKDKGRKYGRREKPVPGEFFPDGSVVSDRRHLVEELALRQHLTGQDGCLQPVGDEPLIKTDPIPGGLFMAFPPAVQGQRAKQRVPDRRGPWVNLGQALDGLPAQASFSVPGNPRTTVCT